MTVIDLSELKAKVGKTLEVEFSEPLMVEKGRTTEGPVKARVVFLNTGDSLLVRGKVRGKIKLECSRCLEKFDYSFEVPFEEEFKWEVPQGEREYFEKRLSEEDFKLPLGGTDFNLTEFLRQIVALSLPEKPLCREDCKGLCPICGANLNYGECEHVAGGEVSLGDPRWRKLDALLEGGESSGSSEEADVQDEEEEEEDPLCN